MLKKSCSNRSADSLSLDCAPNAGVHLQKPATLHAPRWVLSQKAVRLQSSSSSSSSAWEAPDQVQSKIYQLAGREFDLKSEAQVRAVLQSYSLLARVWNVCFDKL
jgi:hypothetical protein